MREIIIDRIIQAKLKSANLRRFEFTKPLAKMNDNELLDSYDLMIKQRSTMEIAEGMLRRLGDSKNEQIDICSSIPK